MGREISDKIIKNILFLISAVKISQSQYVTFLDKKVVQDFNYKTFFF